MLVHSDSTARLPTIAGILLSSLPVLVACSGDGGTGAVDGIAFEDSAGVVLVRNGGTEPEPARLGAGLVETLRIGVPEGEERYQFHIIRDIARHPLTDEIFVADDGAGGIRVFDRRGQHLRSYGRRGGGPGEFTAPGGLFLLDGGRVMAIDGRSSLASIFEEDGAVVASFPIRLGSIYLYPVGRTAEGWLVWRWRQTPWPERGGVAMPDSIEVRHVPDLAAAVSAGDTLLDRAPLVAHFERTRTYTIANPAGPMTASRPLFAPERTYGADAHGRLHVAHGEPYRIDSYAPDGRLVRSLRRSTRQVPVSDALVAAYERRARTYYDTVTRRGHEFEIGIVADLGRTDLPRAEAVPSTGRILVAADGALWAERLDLVPDPVALVWTRERRPQPRIWDRFDPEGRFVGAVELPAWFTPRALADERTVLGIARDEMDVQYMAELKVDAAGGP